VSSITFRVRTSGGFEVAGGIIALREENVIINATLQRLVERDRLAHELLLDAAKPVKTRLELEVVIAVALRNGRDNSDVVSFRANIVS
jgi:hypothetical protein